MSLDAIQAAIPHREPFLLLDEVVEQATDRIVCRKNFRGDEFWYQGHYPGYPLTPGVLLCEAAMQGGESTLKAGTPSRDVWAATMQPFADAGRKDVFPHHAGHGIGLAHPEPPIHVPDSHDVLLAGDVVTLEPGAYVEGIGGMRIEHNYLITEEGYERLTNHVIALN